jgi:hypothetical protein
MQQGSGCRAEKGNRFFAFLRAGVGLAVIAAGTEVRKGHKGVFARKSCANPKRQGEGPYPKGLPFWPGRGNGVNG